MSYVLRPSRSCCFDIDVHASCLRRDLGFYLCSYLPYVTKYSFLEVPTSQGLPKTLNGYPGIKISVELRPLVTDLVWLVIMLSSLSSSQ